MHINDPLFKVGDFVTCDYENVFVFSYSYEDELHSMYYYGIIIYVDTAYYEYMEEYVYEVLCLDGVKRYFMESELAVI